MGRLLVLILLVVAVAWLLRRALAKGASRQVRGRARAEGELVACAHCGVHLPREEARERAGALYCSDEHARLGGR